MKSCWEINFQELWIGLNSIWLQSTMSLYEIELWNVFLVQKYELEKSTDLMLSFLCVPTQLPEL